MKKMDTEADGLHPNDKEKILYLLYFANSDFDKGFKWYEKYSEKSKQPSFDLIIDPNCIGMRKDKRFVELLKEMKLYDYWKDSL